MSDTGWAAALKKGNEIRFARADLRKRLAKMPRIEAIREVARLLEQDEIDAGLGASTPHYLIESIHRCGPGFAQRLLQRSGIFLHRHDARIRDWTERERAAFASVLREYDAGR